MPTDKRTTQTKLRKVLTFTDVMSIGIGQIIGSGIMVLTGIGIGLTGHGVAYAFVLAACIMIICTMPVAALGSAMPATGGLYSYCKRLIGPRTGFVFLSLLLSANLVMALFAIGFADYLAGLIPAIGTAALNFGLFELTWIQMIALVVFTSFYLTNLRGVKTMAVVEKALVVVLLSSLAFFAFYGLPKVDFGSFSEVRKIIPNGARSFFVTIALLSFATGGAKYVSELGGEMKNPGRDIPLTIVLGTAIVGVFYFIIAIVAAGVLPIAEVSGKPLTFVARAIMPDAVYVFFIVGGGLFALSTSLNAQFAWATKGLYVACQDGWLPSGLGRINRWGAPKYILTIIYGIGVVTILSGKSIEFIALLGNGLSLVYDAIPVFAAALLAKKFPLLHKKAFFRINPIVMYFLSGLAICLLLAQAYISLEELNNPAVWISFVVYLAISLGYAHFRLPHFKDSQVGVYHENGRGTDF